MLLISFSICQTELPIPSDTCVQMRPLTEQHLQWRVLQLLRGAGLVDGRLVVIVPAGAHGGTWACCLWRCLGAGMSGRVWFASLNVLRERFGGSQRMYSMLTPPGPWLVLYLPRLSFTTTPQVDVTSHFVGTFRLRDTRCLLRGTLLSEHWLLGLKSLYFVSYVTVYPQTTRHLAKGFSFNP